MSLYNFSNVYFPNLGIDLKNIPVGLEIFGFRLAFYGLTIAIGMLVGYLIAEKQAKRNDFKTDTLMDFGLIVIVLSIVGARIYYVIFHWDLFRDDLVQIINIRNGGLAIYGGVITAILTAVVFCRIKKVHFGHFTDLCVPGLIAGQAIGRWGNFFNKEAFGKYTNSLFAMQLDINAVNDDYRISAEALANRYQNRPEALANIMEQVEKAVVIDGHTYIQAHPTFLYESVWNIGVLIFLLLYAKKKKFGGELLMWYMVLYGIGRFFIEGLRTDQLFLGSTAIPISQLVAIIMILTGIAVIAVGHFKGKQSRKEKPAV